MVTAACAKLVVPHATSTREGALEQLCQFGARGVLFLGEFEGASQLSEDLEFPGHDRSQSGGDTEEVRRDTAIEVHRQLLLELRRGNVGRLRQGLSNLIDRPVEAVDHGDDLGAKTRRDEDRLVNIALADQRAQYLAPLVLGHRDEFNQVERRVLVINAQ
jgi:hypothetical protein